MLMDAKQNGSDKCLQTKAKLTRENISQPVKLKKHILGLEVDELLCDSVERLLFEGNRNAVIPSKGTELGLHDSLECLIDKGQNHNILAANLEAENRIYN